MHDVASLKIANLMICQRFPYLYCKLLQMRFILDTREIDMLCLALNWSFAMLLPAADVQDREEHRKAGSFVRWIVQDLCFICSRALESMLTWHEWWEPCCCCCCFSLPFLFPLFIIDQLLIFSITCVSDPFLWICHQWVHMLILCLLPNNCAICTYAWVLQIKLMGSRTGRLARSATTTPRSICTAPPAGRRRRRLGMEG